MSDRGQLPFLDTLALVSFILQLVNMELNASQSSNDDILKELQKQDQEYLETIIKNQNKIMSMLEESKSV